MMKQATAEAPLRKPPILPVAFPPSRGDTRTVYPIERGIPVPATVRMRADDKYPFASMKVLDSFFIAEPNKEARKKLWKTMYSTFHSWKKRNASPFKFVRHIMIGGVRVWRIE